MKRFLTLAPAVLPPFYGLTGCGCDNGGSGLTLRADAERRREV